MHTSILKCFDFKKWLDLIEEERNDNIRKVVMSVLCSLSLLQGALKNPVGWFDILSSGWLCFLQVQVSSNLPSHPQTHSVTHTKNSSLVNQCYSFFFFLGLWVTENWTTQIQTKAKWNYYDLPTKWEKHKQFTAFLWKIMHMIKCEKMKDWDCVQRLGRVKLKKNKKGICSLKLYVCYMNTMND